MDLQKLVDTMNETGRLTRANYHVTLGALIKTLEAAPADLLVKFSGGGSPSEAHSYRGYYSDLAFERGPDLMAADVLRQCRAALGAEFEGYKGGDFVMSEDTPLWCSSYGSCGEAIVSTTLAGDCLILVTRDVD
jgi:hypothetical protein